MSRLKPASLSQQHSRRARHSVGVRESGAKPLDLHDRRWTGSQPDGAVFGSGRPAAAVQEPEQAQSDGTRQQSLKRRIACLCQRSRVSPTARLSSTTRGGAKQPRALLAASAQAGSGQDPNESAQDQRDPRKTRVPEETESTVGGQPLPLDWTPSASMPPHPAETTSET